MAISEISPYLIPSALYLYSATLFEPSKIPTSEQICSVHSLHNTFCKNPIVQFFAFE